MKWHWVKLCFLHRQFITDFQTEIDSEKTSSWCLNRQFFVKRLLLSFYGIIVRHTAMKYWCHGSIENGNIKFYTSIRFHYLPIPLYPKTIGLVERKNYSNLCYGAQSFIVYCHSDMLLWMIHFFWKYINWNKKERSCVNLFCILWYYSCAGFETVS